VIKCRWKNRRIAVYPPRKKSPFGKAVGVHKTVNGSEALDEEQTPAEPENNDGKDDNEHSESELSRGYDTVFPQSVPSDTEHDDDHISKSENESSTSEEFSACEPKSFGVDPERADSLISDSLAKNLIKKDAEIVYTDGKTKNDINVDTLSENFSSGERVDVNVLKNRDLVPCDTAYVKVLARGVIDKPLSVYANDFSLSAVKMIALTGGEAVKAVTVRVKEKRKNTEKHGKERKEKNVQSP
jgi:ribosomal protein L18E